MNRTDLIAKKEAVRRQIMQTQREMERERLRKPPSRRIPQLERKIEQLMAEETTLRQEIDKTKPSEEGLSTESSPA